jgi:hypothetical protein
MSNSGGSKRKDGDIYDCDDLMLDALGIFK